MTALAVVAALVAGAAGAVLRYAVARAFVTRPTRLPWAVLIVNVAGSFAAGIGVGLQTMTDAEPWVPLVLVTGFAGGLTTFSTFSTETIQLYFLKRGWVALISVLANLVLGAAAFLLGLAAVLGIVYLTAPTIIPV